MLVRMPWAWAGRLWDSWGHRAACAHCQPRRAQGEASVMKGLGIVLGYFCPYSEFLLFQSGKAPAGDNRTFMAAGNAKQGPR